ncbi:MAG: N-acetylmuramoyl-L-alanine amidase [Roseobacter sp.]
MIVIHYTAMENAAAAIARLCDPAAEVSAHYVIAKDGTLTQLVAEADRAWHAGVGEWQGMDDINSRSIGIELDNRGDHPFPDPQMGALECLIADIRSRWPIPASGIIGHSDMAPGRKIDPGPRFDWTRLARQGLAAQPCRGDMPPTVGMDAFRSLAHKAGYTAMADDAAVLAAVRARFRPHASGPLCAADFAVLG